MADVIGENVATVFRRQRHGGGNVLRDLLLGEPLGQRIDGVERGERNLALLNIRKVAKGLKITEKELF